MAEGQIVWKNKLEEDPSGENINWQRPKWRKDPNDREIQVTRRPKWQKDLHSKKTQMTGRFKWQEDPTDKSIQMTRRSKWEKDPNDKKTKWQDNSSRKKHVTRRVRDKKANWHNANWQNANWWTSSNLLNVNFKEYFEILFS